MPLGELLPQLTAEENAELDVFFRSLEPEDERQRHLVRKDKAESTHRALLGIALSGYGQRMLLHARAGFGVALTDEQGESLVKALKAFLKARAADPSQPTYVLHLAECLEVAGEAAEAARAYETFIIEQSRYPEHGNGRELIGMARERATRLREEAQASADGDEEPRD